MSDRQAQTAWVSRVLGITLPPGTVSPPGNGADSQADWTVAMADWHDGVQTVDQQLTLLGKALRNSGDDDLAEIGELGLSGLTNNTRVPLTAAIMDIGDGKLPSLQAGATKLRRAIATFRSQIESDARVEACDDNPLEIPISIAGTYGDALDALEAVLDRYRV